jgi:hypothetical protein
MRTSHLDHTISDVRQEVAPKAAWGPMYLLAALAYIGAIIAFACLFVTESRKSITDTIITPYDNTGRDGYTCQMISKVTASFQISSESGEDPSQEYNLVNIIESSYQFEQDIAAADPCKLPLTYFPTENTQTGTTDVKFGAMAMRGDSMAYVFNVYTETVISYNYSAGTVDSQYVDYAPITSSLAVDREGFALFLHEGVGDTKIVYRKDIIENNGADEIYSFEYAATPIILNDNLNYIYLAENTTFSALNMTSEYTATNNTLFTVPDGEEIVHVTAYNDGTDIKVYYVNKLDELYMWENGAITYQATFSNHVHALTVDGFDNLYAVTGGHSDGNYFRPQSPSVKPFM